MSRLLLLTLCGALVVFAVVQDRVTAAGARRYVAEQQQRIETGQPVIAVDQIMRPAISRSVAAGAAAAAPVVLAGALIAARLRRASQRFP